MSSMTLSDLSQMFQLRRDTVRVREDLATATQELSSGKSADLGKSVSGNFGPLASIDRKLSAVGAYDTNIAEATLFLDVAQASLERVKNVSDELGLRLSSVEDSEMVSIGNVFAIEAAAAFDVTISSLNGRAAGRSLFAGTATDGAAIAPPQSIMDQLGTVVGGLTNADDVRDAIDTWFTTNFDTVVYTGSADPLPNLRVGDAREVSMSFTANDPTIREQLKGLAMAALIGKTAIADPAEKAKLAQMSGQTLISNRDDIISLQAGVGSAQERVEAARTENSVERTALQIARSEIVSIDPFKVATELQNLQTQLETIYTITARLSGLSLTNYLR
jgi:flagellar hook-associated protein 3 FlgL